MRSPALQEHQATMVTPKGLTPAYEDIKGAVAEAIKARLAAAQPLAEVLYAPSGTSPGRSGPLRGQSG
jgi:hypothetical protein